MDVNRLSEALGWLRVDEADHKIQAKLVAVQSALQNLSGSPGDQSHQVALTSALNELEDVLKSVMQDYDPSQMSRIEEIGGIPYFTTNLVDRIRTQINSNPMSPAVALEDVNKLVDQRKAYIQRVKSTEEGVDSFVEYTSGLSEGEASLGFEIPRELFDNEFSDFISELRTIQRILRTFSEVHTGTAPDLKLGRLSSSNPLIFLEAPPVLVLSIAASIAWILSQWKKFEEIRKVRAETAKLGSFDQSELEEFFDRKINNELDKAIKERAESLLDASSLDQGRKNELNSELGWALKALFARIERGMRVEVKVELIEEKEGEELSGEDQEKQTALSAAKSLASDLTYPRIEAEPILTLPGGSDDNG